MTGIQRRHHITEVKGEADNQRCEPHFTADRGEEVHGTKGKKHGQEYIMPDFSRAIPSGIQQSE